MIFINFLLLLIIGVCVVFIQNTEAQVKPQQGAPSTPILMTKPTSNDDKHHLTIIYEALCPDSERFMYQLGPVYEALKDHLQMEFVPYGLTKLRCKNIINGKCEHPTFTCKHGPSGCHANRQHDCALQYSESQEQQMNFIMCTMGRYKTDTDKCLNLLGFSIYDVDICMTFDEGTELQLKSYAKTEVYKPKKLPIIIFDHNFSKEIQEIAVKNFRILCCSLLANKYQIFNQTTAPALCQTNDIFPGLTD